METKSQTQSKFPLGFNITASEINVLFSKLMQQSPTHLELASPP